MPTAYDLTGRRFGNLVAIEPTQSRQSGSVCWRCVCDCGRETVVSVSKLLSGDTLTCGAHRRIERAQTPDAYDALPGENQPLVAFVQTGYCQMCGKKIDPAVYAGKLYCSRQCVLRASRARLVRRNGTAPDAAREPVTRTCEMCGQPYLAYSPQSVRCPSCKADADREARRESMRRCYAGKGRVIGSTDLCERCGAPYIIANGRQKYCKACAGIAQKESERRGYLKYKETPKYAQKEAARKTGSVPFVRACKECGKTFEPEPRKAMYCSEECEKAARQRMNAQSMQRRKAQDGGEFAALLKRYRQAHGLTQTQAAGQCAVSKRMIVLWEQGASRPTAERRRALYPMLFAGLTLGQALDSYLRIEGITRAAFAERLGVSRQTVHMWCDGQNEISEAFRARVAELIGYATEGQTPEEK